MWGARPFSALLVTTEAHAEPTPLWEAALVGQQSTKRSCALKQACRRVRDTVEALGRWDLAGSYHSINQPNSANTESSLISWCFCRHSSAKSGQEDFLFKCFSVTRAEHYLMSKANISLQGACMNLEYSCMNSVYMMPCVLGTTGLTI